MYAYYVVWGDGSWDMQADGRARRYELARRLPLAERRPLWIGRPASSQAVSLPRRPPTRDVTRATALQSTRVLSHRLRTQSAVMTIEAATTLRPCGGLC